MWCKCAHKHTFFHVHFKWYLLFFSHRKVPLLQRVWYNQKYQEKYSTFLLSCTFDILWLDCVVISLKPRNCIRFWTFEQNQIYCDINPIATEFRLLPMTWKWFQFVAGQSRFSTQNIEKYGFIGAPLLEIIGSNITANATFRAQKMPFLERVTIACIFFIFRYFQVIFSLQLSLPLSSCFASTNYHLTQFRFNIPLAVGSSNFELHTVNMIVQNLLLYYLNSWCGKRIDLNTFSRLNTRIHIKLVLIKQCVDFFICEKFSGTKNAQSTDSYCLFWGCVSLMLEVEAIRSSSALRCH